MASATYPERVIRVARAHPTPDSLKQLTGLTGAGRPLAVEFGKYPSALMLLIEELGGYRFGAPRPWRQAVVAACDPRDLATLAPLVKSPPAEIPSVLCSLPHRNVVGFVPLEEDLERIAATPPDVLAAQLPTESHWQEVGRSPRRWLDRFVRAARRACQGLDGPWRTAAGLLDREAERVGVAAVRGAELELISMRVRRDSVRLEAAAPPGAELSAHLAMVPLLAGPGADHLWIIDGRLTHIAYQLPDAWRLLEGDAPPAAALEGLLGPQRALILRRLDRPTTAGELAGALLAVPSAASHHVSVLERAGLVERERQGRQVMVRRTQRGTELLALYDD
ncbi:MAG: winged helix-turn-helix domain-containing protein [Actinomycetota bacterium]|nr:winged helix-turn-helix domain-containing protein [Actinomycetota bacterium]